VGVQARQDTLSLIGREQPQQAACALVDGKII
jgi:hypothetical protein